MHLSCGLQSVVTLKLNVQERKHKTKLKKKTSTQIIFSSQRSDRKVPVHSQPAGELEGSLDPRCQQQ